MDKFKDTLVKALNEAEISFNDNMIELSYRYCEKLLQVNKTMNLTAITDPKEVAQKHFLDSLIVLKYVDFPANAKVIDIGSGNGFPGLALKIFRPDLKITLLDTLKKRCDFLIEISTDLGFSDVEVIWGRAEEKGRDSILRDSFDIAIARAVAQLRVLLEYLAPFVKEGGKIITLKGSSGLSEKEEAKKAMFLLSAELTNEFTYTLPSSDGNRCIFLFDKKGKTPKPYPRKPGTPAKKPL